ncbi:MAG: alpha-hydroxy acid oxidase [Thiolinea sp.]
MPRLIYDFIAGATGREQAKQFNRDSIQALRLQPRILKNVENRTTQTTLLGRDYGLPFGIAPMGMCNLVWPQADTMLAGASAYYDIPLCLSSAASTSIEDMASLNPERSWFQLYVTQSKEEALILTRRAANNGYDTLVFTVDVPQVSRRIRDLRNGFQMPFHIGPKQFLDFALHPHWSLSTLRHGAPEPVNFKSVLGDNTFSRNASRGGCDWEFLAQLREHWQGKLIVKGVLHPEDAVRIRDSGADAVYISNHGGRQLDSAPPAIMALPLIREAVGQDFPLLFDSGLRSGEDIVKALALGADFVMLGRPLLFAIGADSERGLNTLIQLLADEINVVMAQLGITQVTDIDREVIAETQSSTFWRAMP